MSDREPVVAISDLVVEITSPRGTPVTVLRGIDLDLPAGEATGVVGESGSGKTMTGLAVIGLLPRGGRVVRGRIRHGDHDLVRMSQREWGRVRGRRISMIFQDARTSLNPLFTVGHQIARLYQLHGGLGQREAWKRAVDSLTRVGIPDAGRKARQYPHEFSGGMCQRVAIAMALACSPRLLIADEPTTGLDVTVGAQVLDLLIGVVAEQQMAMMMISHDFGSIARTCSRVAVMYAGEVMEHGSMKNILEHPAHPYSLGLLSCLELKENRRMNYIPGAAPELDATGPGCAFAPRCPVALPVCDREQAPVRGIGDDHWYRCHRRTGRRVSR